MRKSSVGNLVIILFVVGYLILGAPLISFSEWAAFLGTSGIVLSSTAMILMTVNIILATRPRWLEDYFGGLDRMYVTHRWTGTAAYGLLILHWFTFFELPPESFGTALGSVALIGLSVLVILSLAPRIPKLKEWIKIPYDKWKLSHRFIGVFFIIGLIHYFFVHETSTAADVYMLVFAFTGAALYLYRQLFQRSQVREPYTVSAVNHPAPNVTEVVLDADEGKPLIHQAGQFLVVKFDEPLAEAHPYTISSAPREQQLRLTMKDSGDWSGRVQERLKAGMSAEIEGSYGRFLSRSDSEQLWIAGGIGVTPFLSMVRELAVNPRKPIHFIYLAQNEDEAVFWDEFVAADAEYPNFHAYRHLSVDKGFLKPQEAAEMVGGLDGKEVLFCGPLAARESFQEGFEEMGLESGRFHFEEFRFR